MSTTTTTTAGHGQTDFSNRLAAMIRDERLSVRDAVSAVARALDIAISGQPIVDGCAHQCSVSSGRLVSLVVHDEDAATPLDVIHGYAARFASRERAEQSQEV